MLCFVEKSYQRIVETPPEPQRQLSENPDGARDNQQLASEYVTILSDPFGKKGQKLRQIGESARMDIERMVGTKVFLKLFVRVQKNWSKDTKALRRFGY